MNNPTTPLWAALLAWLALALGLAAIFSACVSPPPLQAIPLEHPWLADAHELAEDWEATEGLPSLDTPRCRRYIERVRVVHTTEREFADHTGFCPMTETGCSTMGGCPGDRCVTGSLFISGGDIVTIFLSPGEDASGHRITVRHEMAHALFACTTGAFDSAHTDRRVWDGVVWRKRLDP